MSAKEQIGKEVRNVAQPIVHAVTTGTRKVISLAKNIIPTLVQESVDDLELLVKVPMQNLSSPLSTRKSQFVLED